MSEDQAGSPELLFGDLDGHSEGKSSQSEASHLHFTLVVFLCRDLSVNAKKHNENQRNFHITMIHETSPQLCQLDGPPYFSEKFQEKFYCHMTN